MTTGNHTIRMIDLRKLEPHPLHANLMPARIRKKLFRHLAQTGLYEPLIVRPHTQKRGRYQIIHGHHRAQILQKLGHEKLACLIWRLTDAQTLLLLATINRLAGRDHGGKRLALLQAIASEIHPPASSATSPSSPDALASLSDLVPEDATTLQRLLDPVSQTNVSLAEPPALANMPEAFTVFLPAAQKEQIVRALRQTDPDPARALLAWSQNRPSVPLVPLSAFLTPVPPGEPGAI